MSLILSGDTGVPVTTVTGTLPVANGGSGVTTSTGSGANVLGTSPTLATPVINSATVATVSGTAPLYMCRAWVSLNGTGTIAIRGSGNVSSITDNGVGIYTVTFTTAMTDLNYSFAGACSRAGAPASIGVGLDATILSTSFQVKAFNDSGAGFDSEFVTLAIFR